MVSLYITKNMEQNHVLDKITIEYEQIHQDAAVAPQDIVCEPASVSVEGCCQTAYLCKL